MRSITLEVSLSLAIIATAALGADKVKPPNHTPAAQMSAQQSQQQKAMEAMQRAATPGAPQKMLDAMAGEWNATVSMWETPGGKPAVEHGTSTNQWVLGNRYLAERFSGSFMGQPFSGIGYTGYDNVSKKYWSTWIDSMSTGVMTQTGTTADGKTWSFSGSMNDPVSGKPMTTESRVIVADHDHHTMEMWMPGPNGKKFKSMEISYVRKK